MTLSLDTAYRSFGGEVEASSTPTICRPPDSRRHQFWAIAPNKYFHVIASNGIVSSSPYIMTASPTASVRVFETIRDADVVTLRSVRHATLSVRDRAIIV